MSSPTRKTLQIVIDNLFWLFVALMILLGMVLPQPFIAVSSGG